MPPHDRQPPRLAVVVPCYEEEEVLPASLAALQGALEGLRQEGLIAAESFIYCVDDGSRDATWRIIAEHHQAGGVRGLRLACNYGHQHALLAGLLAVCERVDCAISIDADLQDDITLMREMVLAYRDGSEIVCAVNGNRDSDSLFKRNTALLYYRLLHLLQVKVIKDHADYRLLGRRALDALGGFGERNLFLRGLIPLLSGRIAIVEQARRPRLAGRAKYDLVRMARLAWDGITSFSIAPLRLMLLVGALIFGFSLLLSGYALWVYFIRGGTVLGWASTVLPIYLFSGLQLLGIGLLGEYLGKIYLEVKRRPRFLADEELGE